MVIWLSAIPKDKLNVYKKIIRSFNHNFDKMINQFTYDSSKCHVEKTIRFCLKITISTKIVTFLTAVYMLMISHPVLIGPKTKWYNYKSSSLYHFFSQAKNPNLTLNFSDW